jgi:hypothetical protein
MSYKTLCSARRTSVVAASALSALLLVGCSGTAGAVDQSVTVTYVDAGETVKTTVDIPELDCSELAGTLLYSLDGENKDSEWGTLTAGATADAGSYNLSVALGEGFWFVSTNEYGSTENSLTLSDLEGIVVPVTFADRSPDFGDAVDTAATATGDLECTSVD